MASPSTTLTDLRPDLAGSLEEFDLAMARRGYIASLVAPVINVGLASGTFGRIPIEQLLQNRDTIRAPGSGYNRGKFQFEQDTFITKENGFEEPVDDNEASMYASFFDAEQLATLRCQDAVLTNYEKRVADMIFNATTWTGASLTTAVTNEWDDYVNATPIADVEGAVANVYDASGLWPNTLVINRKAFRNLRRVEEIKEAIAALGAGDSTTAKNITAAKLAEVFDLERIIVAGATKNSAAMGQAATPAQIWSSEYAMVAHIDFSEDVRRPTVARTFHWTGDGSEIDGRVETYRDEPVRSEIVRVRHQTAEKVMHVQAGHLLSNITT